MRLFHRTPSSTHRPEVFSPGCEAVRANFSGYLDGVITGHEMAAMATHLESCAGCAQEFATLRSVGTVLGTLGPARAPEHLQSRLRSLAAAERVQGNYLPLARRLALLWERTLAPLAVRTAGGLAVAAMLALGVARVFAPVAAVQANDDRMAHLVAPHYLYSQVPLQPVMVSQDTPVLVDAKVDERGRVYDFAVLEGPGNDPATRLRIQANLLASVFKPASLFGEPVRGHVVLTYEGVSARR